MNVFIIRHADAAPLGEWGIHNDEDRPLTPLGKAQCAALASVLMRHDLRFELLVTSPFVRARQTAEAIRDALPQSAPEIVECGDLAPLGKRRKLAKFLARLAIDSVGVIGHQPDLAEWIGWLIGSRKARIDIAKAGMAQVVTDGPPRRGSGTLIWLATPEWYGGGPPDSSS
jgi:phosphohistidine phosphatase